MTENDILLTVRESAKLLHMSVSTFHRHVTNGSLPKPLKFGFLSRWLQSDLLNVIEQAKQQRQSDKDGQGFLKLITLKIAKSVL